MSLPRHAVNFTLPISPLAFLHRSLFMGPSRALEPSRHRLVLRQLATDSAKISSATSRGCPPSTPPQIVTRSCTPSLHALRQRGRACTTVRSEAARGPGGGNAFSKWDHGEELKLDQQNFLISPNYPAPFGLQAEVILRAARPPARCSTYGCGRKKLLRVLEAHELSGLGLGECMRSNLAAQLP